MTTISWNVEVLVEGKWTGNGVYYATRGEAEAAGRDLLSRWFVPTDSRAVESEKPVNYRRLENGSIERVEVAA